MEASTRPNPPYQPGNVVAGNAIAGNSAADGAVHKAAASVHSAVDKLAGAADEATRNVKPAIARAAQVAHSAVNTAADAAGPAADWLSAQGNSLRETQRKMVADAGQYVAASPWKTLGFTLAAGFLIGRLMR